MAALNSKARAVIEEARVAMRPPTGERERLEALLDAHLGAAAPSPAAHVQPARALAGWRLVTSLTVGIALIGGVALWARHPRVSQSSPPLRASASQEALPPVLPAPPTTPSAEEVPAPITALPARPAKPPVETQAPAQHAQDRLAQEVALLSRATSDLRAGRAGAALKSLDDHQRKFPNGMLAVERRAVRAQALCTLKRVNEGRAELSQLAPQSPAAGRARQLCDAAASSLER